MLDKVLTQTKAEQLNTLYAECGLKEEDYYKHSHYTIITRTGIEKIQFAKNIKVTYETVQCGADFCAIKAVGLMGEERIETYGSAYQKNCKNSYYLEMAEKRALSRVVLKLTKAYSIGVFGEDEADDFKK